MSPKLNTDVAGGADRTSHATPQAIVRAVFLDVDGTYADYGVVPEGHVRVVRAARQAGHRVFLCTGRPVSMLPASITGAGFDGIVASAGAYLEIGGKVLMDRRLPTDLADRTLAALNAHDAVYILEAPEALYVPPAVEGRLRTIVERHFSQHPDGPEAGASSILSSLRAMTGTDTPAFAKVSVFESPVPMARLVQEIGADIDVVANSIVEDGRHAGELYQRGVSKADGVAAAIAHLDIPRENTVAVGDGQNDLEMIAFAGVGVVIEGAAPELLALADRTAAPPHQEGLVAAFIGLGLV